MAVINHPQEELKSVRIAGTETATVHLQLNDGLTGNTYDVIGEAKKHPKDEPNPALGAKLALARALLQLGDQLLEEAWVEIYPSYMQLTPEEVDAMMSECWDEEAK